MMDCDDGSSMDVCDIILSRQQDRWLQAAGQLKCRVIGSNRQKESALQKGILPRLLEWIQNESVPQELRTEAAILLGSLAFGTAEHIQQLVHAGAVPVLLSGLSNQDETHVEACLRCLRTIFTAANPPVELIYRDLNIIPLLLNIISRSICTKETVANILANSCTSSEHQNTLMDRGAIPCLAPLLGKNNMYKIQMPILKFFAALCYNNPCVCGKVLRASVNGESVVEMIRKLQSRSKTSEMQMAAAKCLAYLHRGEDENTRMSRVVVNETLHTLVRMLKKDRTLDENVDGAQTLSHLIEGQPDLQKRAAMCDHAMKALAEYLGYTEIQQLDSRQTQKKEDWGNMLKAAAFQAFAALGANDEEIKQKIVHTENLVTNMVACMESDDERLQEASCRCLQSLTRSVQLLRTILRDYDVWKPLTRLLESRNFEVKKVATSTLCNMLLDFSPSKEELIDGGAIRILVDLCKEDEMCLRLNGVWGLMNLTYNAELKLKLEVLELLGSDLLSSLLNEHEPEILSRTLVLLRNLASKNHHVDNIMAAFGTIILQAINTILPGDYSIDMKQHALCILVNVADGQMSKKTLLDNDEIMKYLLQILEQSDDVKLQAASICVIKNLLSGDDDDRTNRMMRLHERGVDHLLESRAQSKDAHVQYRAKSALNHFKDQSAVLGRRCLLPSEASANEER